MSSIIEVARAICKSRTCRGSSCCQWPANMGLRHKCPVERGGYDDAAVAAINAVLADRENDLERACAADFAYGQPGVDPDAAWAMLADEHKPAIRARVRAVLEAGRRG